MKKGQNSVENKKFKKSFVDVPAQISKVACVPTRSQPQVLWDFSQSQDACRGMLQYIAGAPHVFWGGYGRLWLCVAAAIKTNYWKVKTRVEFFQNLSWEKCMSRKSLLGKTPTMHVRKKKQQHMLYMVFLISEPLRKIIGTAQPYLAVPDVAPLHCLSTQLYQL